VSLQRQQIHAESRSELVSLNEVKTDSQKAGDTSPQLETAPRPRGRLAHGRDLVISRERESDVFARVCSPTHCNHDVLLSFGHVSHR